MDNKSCKTCRYWDTTETGQNLGQCLNIDIWDRRLPYEKLTTVCLQKQLNSQLGIAYRVDDDSGLDISIITGCNFYCAGHSLSSSPKPATAAGERDTRSRNELLELLAEWWIIEDKRPLGPSNPELSNRVWEVLAMHKHYSQTMLLDLLNETRTNP